MKTAKIVSIVCWLVTALILIGLVIWFLSGNLFGFRTGYKINMPFFHISSFESLTGPFNAVGTFEATVGDVDSLDINWTAGEVTVTPYDGDVVKVIEYAQRELSDNEKFICSISGGTLEVKYCDPGWNRTNLTKRLEVLVPTTLADKIDVLDVAATSADVIISNISVNTFNLKEVSGNSEISNIKTATSGVHAVSGTIDIEIMTTRTLTMGTVSGEINLTNVTADTLIANSTSGDQDFDGTFKSVDAGSVSGEIRVTSSIDPDNMKIGTTSGGITVTIPGTTDPVVSYSTTSGDFNTDIPIRTSGSSDYRLTSVSGSINLKTA